MVKFELMEHNDMKIIFIIISNKKIQTTAKMHKMQIHVLLFEKQMEIQKIIITRHFTSCLQKQLFIK